MSPGQRSRRGRPAQRGEVLPARVWPLPRPPTPLCAGPRGPRPRGPRPPRLVEATGRGVGGGWALGLGAVESVDPARPAGEEDDARRAQVSGAGVLPPAALAALAPGGLPARGLEPAPEGAAGRAQAAAESAAAAAAAEARLRGWGWPLQSARAPRSLASGSG